MEIWIQNSCRLQRPRDELWRLRAAVEQERGAVRAVWRPLGPTSASAWGDGREVRPGGDREVLQPRAGGEGDGGCDCEPPGILPVPPVSSDQAWSPGPGVLLLQQQQPPPVEPGRDKVPHQARHWQPLHPGETPGWTELRALRPPVDLRGRQQLGDLQGRLRQGRLWPPGGVQGLCGHQDQ